MYLNKIRLHSLAVLVALFVLFFSSSVQAQQPELTETIVYGINATTPGQVFANLSPPQVEDIYILANRVSIISPRLTMVYFWPLTQRYRGHWEELNEPLDGVLEIIQDDHVVSTVNLTTYTVHYAVAGSTKGELYIGREAVEADSQFYFSRESSLQAMAEFRQARLQWLENSRTAQIAGERVPIREEPPRPTTFTTLSVGLQQGFPLNLETGEYQIRMRGAQNEIIPGSHRTVHVFESRQTSLGFEIIPEEHWTIPEQVNDATAVIPAEPGSIIYLTPRLMHEYPALAIERLRDTQFSGAVEDKWHWVTDFDYIHSPHDVLEIIRRGKLVEQITYASYSVRFALDRESGYEILRYDVDTPRLTPNVDIIGYRVEMPRRIDNFTIRLKTETDPPYEGTVRKVRVLPEDLSPFILPVAVIFAAFVLSLLVIWQRLFKRSRIR